MSGKIRYSDEITKALAEVQGTDGRLNVSSRADGRGYYNSRDMSETYNLLFDDANATADDIVVYLKNDKTDGKHLVVNNITVNGEVLSKFTLVTVTGTAAGGAAVSPVNLNFAGVSKEATVTALATADSSVTPMSGLTVDKEVSALQVQAGGREKFVLADQPRLGQGQAMGIRMDSGTADSYVFGTINFFFE